MSADWRAELRSWAEAASPGPWRVYPCTPGTGTAGNAFIRDNSDPIIGEVVASEFWKMEDARLASLGREVPGLVDALTELRDAVMRASRKDALPADAVIVMARVRDAYQALAAVQRAVQAQRGT